jgi:hypothetical protein
VRAPCAQLAMCSPLCVDPGTSLAGSFRM